VKEETSPDFDPEMVAIVMVVVAIVMVVVTIVMLLVTIDAKSKFSLFL
jgi:hypothetical protein